MFRKSILLLLVLLLNLVSSAAEKNSKAPIKFAPPPIVINVAGERPRVAVTGEFFALPLSAASRGKVKLAASSSAAVLTERDKQFTWKPSPLLSSTIRNADLTGAAISEDGTIALITERVGGEDKPNSTRFILFNIPEKCIAGGFTVKEALIDSPVFIPGRKDEVIGIRRSSSYFNTCAALVRISLRHKEVMDYAEISGRDITSFALGPDGKIFCSVSSSPDILVYDWDNMGGAPQKIRSRLNSPKLVFAGEKLVAAGKAGVEIFHRNSRSWESKERFYSAPAGFSARNMVVIDPVVPAICFTGGFEDDFWYFRQDTFKKIKERISGVQTWDSSRKIFFAELAANSKVAIFQMPEAIEANKAATPNRLKPVSRNGSFALLRVPSFKDQMLQIDIRGNVFLLDYSRIVRWKKFPVYIADRAGLRN